MHLYDTSLYFQTLAVMGVVFLVAGLANTWSLVYFREESYSGGQDQINEEMWVSINHQPSSL